jgi:hypothetical protein
MATVKGPPVPAMGTYPCAANQMIPKFTIVTQDTAGRAVSPSSSDVSGFPAVGMSEASYNNKTGSELGGLADACDVEVGYGVYGWGIVGTVPTTAGTVMYVVDNQNVSADSLNGARGFAGIFTEYRDGQCFIFMGPLAARMAAGPGEGIVSLDNWHVASTGAALAAFSNGVADGYSLVSSEGFGIRFNDDTTTAIATTALIPADVDVTQPIVFHALGFRTGTADVTAALTLAAFIVGVGSLITADADAGGATSAFDAVAANTVQEVTRTIAAADLVAGPASLTLTLVPTAALDDDDLVILRAWITYAKR